MNKRLLLISSNSSERGGGEHYLVYLTQGLQLIGYEVWVLLSTASYMNNWANRLTSEGAKVHRQHLIALRHRPLRFVQSILDSKQQLSIAKFCQEIAPDAILVNQQYDEDGLDYLAGALKSNVAPVGGIIHMPMTANKHNRPLGKLRGQLLKLWYKTHPYSMIFVSTGSQKEFESYYNCPRPTSVVHHGCPFPEIKRLSISANWKDNLPVICFSGQFVAQKNLYLLIDAWLWTRRKGIDSRLLLIGDGSERNSLEEYLQSSAPVGLWHITGWQNQIDAYLSLVDIYAMTSHFEGLPLALIEAAGRGLPAVVTNFNGATDVAKHAPWVSIVTEANPDSFGYALMESINKITQLKQQAKDGQKKFRDYFSPQRMAIETLAALGID